MTTPKPDAPKEPSWANLFDEIALTPEEEKALDAAWASPEVQEAVKYPLPVIEVPNE